MQEVADSLVVGKVGVPVIANMRVSSLSDVENIPIPWIGLIFYCLADDQYYKVKTLKAVNGIDDLAVDTYVEFGTSLSTDSGSTDNDSDDDDNSTTTNPSTSSSHATLTIAIPSDPNNDNLTCYVQLSESMTFDSVIELNSSDNDDIMVLGYDGAFNSIPSEGISFLAYGGKVIVTLDNVEGFDISKVYYARACFNDGSDDSSWKVGILNINGKID